MSAQLEAVVLTHPYIIIKSTGNKDKKSQKYISYIKYIFIIVYEIFPATLISTVALQVPFPTKATHYYSYYFFIYVQPVFISLFCIY
jgi:hypothetical protein